MPFELDTVKIYLNFGLLVHGCTKCESLQTTNIGKWIVLSFL